MDRLLTRQREYRRFVGDYVLNQNDVIAQEAFEDRVAFGGWSIDLHPPQGMYSTAKGSKHMHMDGSYHIPFRSLFSANVSNMLMAGRNISASHVAFGTTRVMATCAVIGEAAGTGAALCAMKNTSPRVLHAEHLDELQQTLLRQDASVLGLKNTDPHDLALRAEVNASSTLSKLALEYSIGTVTLNTDLSFIIPADPGIDGIELLVDASSDTELIVELWSTGKPQNYVPHSHEATAKVSVTAGEKQWILAGLSWYPDNAQNAFIIVKQNPAVAPHLSDRPLTGVLAFKHAMDVRSKEDFGDMHHHQPVVDWSGKSFIRKPICFKLHSISDALAAHKATDGYTRPYGGPHMWSSQPMDQGKPEWLELSWQEDVQVGCIHITFNDDVNEDLINLHHHRTPFEIIPELAKDYQIQAWVRGEWITLAEEHSNHTRKRVHKLASSIETSKLRIVVTSTNGSERAEIVEVRCYE